MLDAKPDLIWDHRESQRWDLEFQSCNNVLARMSNNQFDVSPSLIAVISPRYSLPKTEREHRDLRTSNAFQQMSWGNNWLHRFLDWRVRSHHLVDFK
jgi:hypothetical protein